MDNWNRNDENEYTGMTAQRRNRRRIETNGEQPAARPDPAVPAEEDRMGEWAEAGIPDVFTMPEKPEEKEEPAASEAADEPVITEGPAEPEEPAEAEPDEKAEPAEEPEKAEAPEEPRKPEAPAAEKEEAPVEPVVQAADSRVPPEARRMAAAPYGTAREGAKRPGTRPQVAPKRPPMPEEKRPPVRPRREAPINATRSTPIDATRSTPRPQAARPPRVSVGYAPGRMNDEETRQIPTADAARQTLYGRDAKAYLEKRRQPFRMDEGNGGRPPEKPGHKTLRVIVALLVIAGLVLSGWMLLKNRGSKNQPENREAPQVISFDTPNTEGLIAPVELNFSAETGKDVENIRMCAEDGTELPTVVKCGDNADSKIWTIKMPMETGYSGVVKLQAYRSAEEGWIDTGSTAEVSVSTPLGVDTPAETAGGPEDATPTPDPDDEDYYIEDEDLTADAAGIEAGIEGGTPGEEEQATVPETPKPDEVPDEETPEEPPEDRDEIPTGAITTPGPTNTPGPTAAPEATAEPLVAEAAPEADPGLITQTTVWTSFTKKEKSYSRSAKELIHMPEADEYTKNGKKLGVLTFRGDNFRRNAASGTLSAPPERLAILWQTEAGSARGTNQTFYGYGWTGQPVIARWSTEIRSKSNITESKIEKSSLKEVIIAGVDGVIRFLDLEDGKITRNSIKLGYPMKGTPSLHPRGYPFLSVGQFARKMKSKTGKIGLRQYNLYTQGELRLIDGLDGKYHRPLNDIGSFETSALIDWTSDTLITAGTNGMLYLESLGTNFDYNMGVLQISPSIVAMSSRAKGQKSNALLAVESSLAAYDRYVFYADMGGVLRCVDTNSLTPVWAVDTGDSVMAAVALDMTENRQLNLYTANMLNNRKKGNGSIQIRRYDAMSGKEAWCTDVGVFKSKKDKEKDNVGAKASPVIGQYNLSDMVYFTVTGLSEEGAEALGLNGETPAALIALNKDNGRVVWAFGLGSRSESSPIALYDNDGNGWIVQCEQKGIVHLIDGRSGREKNSLDLEAEIEASPAAYNNVVVIGTTGKGTAFVYGIEVRLEKTEAADDNMPAEDENAGENEEAEPAEEEPAEDEAGEDEWYDEEDSGGA